MLVHLCDSCRAILGPETDALPCVAVALRTGATLALKRVGGDGEPNQIPPASAHFCSDECVTRWVEKWLAGLLPAVEPPAPALVQSQPHPARTRLRPALQLVADMTGMPPVPSDDYTDAPPEPAPAGTERRAPTPQELAEQASLMATVLGGGSAGLGD
jgi:hypothetical protein